MSTTGLSAAMTGDKLKVQTVDPAFPQSIPVLELPGQPPAFTGLGAGDLLVRVGFQITGQTASESV